MRMLGSLDDYVDSKVSLSQHRDIIELSCLSWMLVSKARARFTE